MRIHEFSDRSFEFRGSTSYSTRGHCICYSHCRIHVRDWLSKKLVSYRCKFAYFAFLFPLFTIAAYSLFRLLFYGAVASEILFNSSDTDLTLTSYWTRLVGLFITGKPLSPLLQLFAEGNLWGVGISVTLGIFATVLVMVLAISPDKK